MTTVPAMMQGNPDADVDAVRTDLLAALGEGSDPAPDVDEAAATTTQGVEADDLPGDDAATGADVTPEQAEAAGGDQTAGDEPAAATTETESHESETEADPTDAAAEAGEEPGDDEALDALARERKWPQSYLRRIKKLTAAKRETESAAQAEVSRLQAELEELKANPEAAKAVVTDVEQGLTGEIATLERVLDFVDDNPDGGRTADGREWSREELRAERRKAERALREKEVELLEMRKVRAAKAREIETLLPQRHPALKDRTSDHARAVDQFLRQYPVLKADPVLRLMAADALAYNLALTRVKPGTTAPVPATVRAAATATATTPPAPPAPRPAARAAGRPVAQAPAANGSSARLQASRQQFMESGDPEAGKRFIESMLG